MTVEVSFNLISFLDDQHNFHTLPHNPQQILTCSRYIFKNFIIILSSNQNTVKLYQDIDKYKFDLYFNSPSC